MSPTFTNTNTENARSFVLMNPYEPTLLDGAIAKPIATRGARTCMYGTIVGVSMSLIAPICNATYCTFFLDFPFMRTLGLLLREMTPPAALFALFAMGISFLIPNSLSHLLSFRQQAIPVVAITVLFSLYFGLLGFGYVSGGFTILHHHFTFYEIAPAAIVGIGTLLYLIVHPKRLHGVTST
jgi:hypothetical protein